jgi:hypothetical protein
MVRVERIELSSRPWEGRILATIRYPPAGRLARRGIKNGAISGIRTPDPRFTKAVL